MEFKIPLPKKKRLETVKQERDEEKPKRARKTDDEKVLEIDSKTMDNIHYGTKRKQRHWVLQAFTKAALDHPDNIATEEGVSDYMTRLERRIYDGTLGVTMHIVYNLYRGELYRKKTFELIWALRRCAPFLMGEYTPELLASLPPHLITKNTPLGKHYEAWKEKRDRDDQMERDIRHAKQSEKGEGWLKCHKCGGKFEINLLQMRGADEPATVFMRCQNCHFTKRKG